MTRVGRNDPCPCGSGRKFKACCQAKSASGVVASEQLFGAQSAEGRRLIGLLHAGQHSRLEMEIKRLLPSAPGSAFLWGLLGVTLQMRGDDGLAALQRAADLAPGDADALLNLGTALLAQGRASEAVAALRRAVELRPANPATTVQLGNALAHAGRDAEAEAAFRGALGLDGDSVDAMLGLADTLSRRGCLAEAELLCERALVVHPQHPMPHFCKGELRRLSGRLPEAAAEYARVIQLAPAYLPAYNNLGNVLIELGQLAAAEKTFTEVLAIAPAYLDALMNLGRLLGEQDRLGEAEAAYRRVVQQLPGHLPALARLAAVLAERGQAADAEATLRQALEMAPGRRELDLQHALSLLPIVASTSEEASSAPARFASALAACALDHHREDAGVGEPAASLMPFFLAYRYGNHRASLSAFGDLVGSSAPLATLPPARERIRLLVVSRHLRRHSVWDVVLHGLLRHLDRTRFEVVLYHLGVVEDAETAVARHLADVWRDRASVADAAAWQAAVIADAPDAIFYPELGMDPLTYHLASRRLAPLQMAGWGHPITTGLASIDLFLSGELIEPPAASAHYRERLVLLPGAGCCTVPLPLPATPIPEVEAELARSRGVRFVVPQRPMKFDPSDDDLFVDLAEQVPDAVFILCSDPVYPWATDRLLDRLAGAFRNRGLAAEGRFLVLPWLAAGAFLSLMDGCDVYLDCPAFSGYTTAWQALHRGIPIVTMEGACMRQRLAAGVLRQAGLSETVAASRAEYLRLAVRLADESRDTGLRAARRERQRAAAGRVDGDTRVVRAFENVVIAALDNARRG